jgi:hypothetical protein
MIVRKLVTHIANRSTTAHMIVWRMRRIAWPTYRCEDRISLVLVRCRRRNPTRRTRSGMVAAVVAPGAGLGRLGVAAIDPRARTAAKAP